MMYPTKLPMGHLARPDTPAMATDQMASQPMPMMPGSASLPTDTASMPEMATDNAAARRSQRMARKRSKTSGA